MKLTNNEIERFATGTDDACLDVIEDVRDLGIVRDMAIEIKRLRRIEEAAKDLIPDEDASIPIDVLAKKLSTLAKIFFGVEP